MLVINTAARGPHSERRVVEWMRGWTGTYAMSGIAVSSYWLPGAKPGDASQECDFVLITPQASAAIEVKGTDPAVTFGTITAYENGRWRHSDLPGDPINIREKDDNPYRQVLGCAFKLKELIKREQLLEKPWVHGVVLVVPPIKSDVALKVASTPKGATAVIGNNGIRAWLHTQERSKTIWTAEKVHALLTAMNLGDQISIGELVEEGFPGPSTPAWATPATPTRRVAPPAAPVSYSAIPTDPAPEPGAPALDWTAYLLEDSPPPPPRSSSTRRTISRRTGMQAAAAAALIAAIGAGIWAMGATSDNGPQQTSDQQIIESSTETTAPPPSAESPATEPTPPPPGPGPGGCFPFQANC